MFESSVYSKRRTLLRKSMGSGLVLLLGNEDAAFNYPANQYHFRQDSSFLYYFGLDQALSNCQYVYEYLNVYDSIIRERLFEKLSLILNCEYEVIYQRWLSPIKKSL